MNSFKGLIGQLARIFREWVKHPLRCCIAKYPLWEHVSSGAIGVGNIDGASTGYDKRLKSLGAGIGPCLVDAASSPYVPDGYDVCRSAGLQIPKGGR